MARVDTQEVINTPEAPLPGQDYGSYYPIAFNDARRDGLDHASAEDVAQTVMLKIHLTGGIPTTPEGVHEPAAYVHTVTKRTIIDGIRRDKQRHVREEGYFERTIRTQNLQTPVDEWVENALSPDVEVAMQGMKPEYREAFILQVDGYQYNEIAEILGIPMGTVRSRIFRAREYAKQALDKQG